MLKTLGSRWCGVHARIVRVDSFVRDLSIDWIRLASISFNLLTAALGAITMPMSVILLGVGIAVALAIVSGLPPAWRAMRLNIVDALAGR